ncbi:unnamed protein product [Ilex paraguariensis]|uniref:Protein kinase domain-containing protein n=1 Tax=Ilex paraguariensis TaxID=185542 RepID=A0ABC8T1L7_9AQUA
MLAGQSVVIGGLGSGLSEVSCYVAVGGYDVSVLLGMVWQSVCCCRLCVDVEGDGDQLEHGMSTQRLVFSLGKSATEAAHCFTLSELEDATKNFEKKIGSGGFGVVYYGKLKDGKEIAVKVLTSNSYQGKREFSNEVTFFTNLLSPSIFFPASCIC